MFNRILFLATLLLSVTLILSVLLLPSLLEAYLENSPRLLTLLAYDVTIRRASIACAIGLLATALIFFRSGEESDEQPKKKTKAKKSKRARATNTVGA